MQALERSLVAYHKVDSLHKEDDSSYGDYTSPYFKRLNCLGITDPPPPAKELKFDLEDDRFPRLAAISMTVNGKTYRISHVERSFLSSERFSFVLDWREFDLSLAGEIADRFNTPHRVFVTVGAVSVYGQVKSIEQVMGIDNKPNVRVVMSTDQTLIDDSKKTCRHCRGKGIRVEYDPEEICQDCKGTGVI